MASLQDRDFGTLLRQLLSLCFVDCNCYRIWALSNTFDLVADNAPNTIEMPCDLLLSGDSQDTEIWLIFRKETSKVSRLFDRNNEAYLFIIENGGDHGLSN